jgi:hypothetical protein
MNHEAAPKTVVIESSGNGLLLSLFFEVNYPFEGSWSYRLVFAKEAYPSISLFLIIFSIFNLFVIHTSRESILPDKTKVSVVVTSSERYFEIHSVPISKKGKK